GLPPDHRSHPGEYYKGHAHNDYLESLASTGVVGTVFFLGFLGAWIMEVGRRPLARKLFLPVIAAYMVSSVFQNIFTDSEVLNFLLLIYFASQILLDWEDRKRAKLENLKCEQSFEPETQGR
ncbi:MAG: hypothetical protein AAGJ31_10970, partial [Verrucomicrobiota bacterium]